MQQLKKSGMLVAGVITLGVIGSWMTPNVAHADPTVTIGGPLPLPVTVGNTPNVNVANSPTVKVGNTTATPVPVETALQPFQFTQIGALPLFNFPVPGGKTLIVENVSIECQEPPATGYFTDYRVFTSVNGVFAQHSFSPTIEHEPAQYMLITNQQTRIYASGGTSVSIGTGDGTPTGSNCDVTISGELINQ
ncbi:MAG TPA: hypothetical protein VGN17_17950 [Bryobacteraceae bacterium]|jgi:hypothetical protein